MRIYINWEEKESETEKRIERIFLTYFQEFLVFKKVIKSKELEKKRKVRKKISQIKLYLNDIIIIIL